MSAILTSMQMRRAEEAAIASGRATGDMLMERAGRGVVSALFDAWPAFARVPDRAAVLCGPGNNGGDGFVIARLLRDAGWDVDLFLYGDAERLPPDARRNHDRWGDAVAPFDTFPVAGDWPWDVVVDALFGTGLTRGLPDLGALFTAMDLRIRKGGHARPVFAAVDLPSGLCADSGRTFGEENGAAARADLTVTFHRPKHGHILADGPRRCGRLVTVDIGLAPPKDMPDLVRLVTAPSADALSKRTDTHKYGHGHALVLTGGAGRTGAARLSARAALRIGAGLVTLAAPGSAQFEVAAQITALMLRRVDSAADLSDLLSDPRLNALCLGPGLGVDRAEALLPAALAHRGGLVLDADALTALAADPDWPERCAGRGTVLTPHDGEFVRLFPDLAERLRVSPSRGPLYSRIDAARAAAKRAGAVVLLKGPDTVIAAPDGTVRVNAASYARAAPWLATAGAGDVLAGMITGLLARGWSAFGAACDAAWLHAEAARHVGPGLIAEDLPEAIPAVLRSLDQSDAVGSDAVARD